MLCFILSFVFWIFPTLDTAVQLESADSKQNTFSKSLFQDSFWHIFWAIWKMHHTFWKKATFSNLKIFANSQPSASNFKFFSLSLDHFFLTVGQNNLSNKIPLFNEDFEYDTTIHILAQFYIWKKWAFQGTKKKLSRDWANPTKKANNLRS